MTLEHANDMAAQFLHDAQQPGYPHLVDVADLFDDGPTDIQMLDALVEAFDLTAVEIIERLVRADFAALRREVMA
jgi:hypothetical protein